MENRRRHPEWLKVRLPGEGKFADVRALMKGLHLHTVCEEARCPNLAECWGVGTATIMILGDTCTRACRFCAVNTGDPGGTVDPLEPARVARAIAQLGLNYVVITSVDRDDLPDGGASHFAQTVRWIREFSPHTRVELLTPDFQGNVRALRTVVEVRPDVLAQNIETVRRLTHVVRDRRAGYELTLFVLRTWKEMAPDLLTKSSIMVGLGETDEEVLETLRDLRAAGVDIVTIGQYLRPTGKRVHLPVVRYVSPETFAWYREEALRMGFLEVFSGPLVRSSYCAERVFQEARKETG